MVSLSHSLPFTHLNTHTCTNAQACTRAHIHKQTHPCPLFKPVCWFCLSQQHFSNVCMCGEIVGGVCVCILRWGDPVLWMFCLVLKQRSASTRMRKQHTRGLHAYRSSIQPTSLITNDVNTTVPWLPHRKSRFFCLSGVLFGYFNILLQSKPLG